MSGWLQRDRRYITDAIEIANDGLSFDPATVTSPSPYPLWVKIWVRNRDGRIYDVAVVLYTDEGMVNRLGYGITQMHKMYLDDGFSIPIAFDLVNYPDEDAGYLEDWPEISGSPFWNLWINSVDEVVGANSFQTHILEWWYGMLSEVPALIKTEIITCPFTRTLGNGWTAPSADKILDLVSADSDRNLEKLKMGFQGVMVVIHETEDIQPDIDFSGGFGRKGRQVRTKISVIARKSDRSDETVESTKLYLGYLAEDLIEEFDPPGGPPNHLGGYAYETDFRMTVPPTPAPAFGEDASVAIFELDVFKMQYAEGDSPPFISGDGIVFNLNQPMIDSTVLNNDHCYFFVEETGYWHRIGIKGSDLTTPSHLFKHQRSLDLRSWEDMTDLSIGSGTPGHWRCYAYAPEVKANPNYGEAGKPMNTYRYVMTATGVQALGVGSQEKIGRWYTNDIALEGWLVAGPSGIGDDSPVYWAGMPTTGYPLGSTWCPTTYYENGVWGGASRDSCMFTDGSNWYMILTTKNSANGYQAVGFAIAAGGVYPDFGDWEHMPAPLVVNTDSGLQFESTYMALIDGRWYFFYTGTSGTRVQSSTSNPTTLPFSGDPGAGNLVNITGPEYVSASDLQLIEDDVWLIGGHKLEADRCWIVINELDFGTLISDPVDGDYPTESGQVGIAGLVALNEDVLDRSIRWTIEDSEGASGAFYRQPVWGDQALAAGEGASGMTGNSYIATNFRHWYPDAGLDGVKYSDYSRVGWIKSSAFEITRNRISLKIGGGGNENLSFVALVRADDHRILFKSTGTGTHQLTERLWDTSSLRSEAGGRGLQVYLVMCDQGTGDMDCLDVDNIREYEKVGADPVVPILPEANGELITALIHI